MTGFTREILRYVLIPAVIGGIVGLVVMTMKDPGAQMAGSASRGYADAVARAAPSVVNIYSSKVSAPAICQHPRYRQLCESLSGDSRSRVQSSLGSGVIVRDDGYILTNNHVIEEADEILVAFANGQATTATVVGVDAETDIAVIKVQASGLTVIPFGSSDTIRVGDIALAIGNPFGIGQTVSQGIVSAKGRAGISESPFDDFIQTDAAINPGNSGGALIDTNGELIGINTLIFSHTGESEGIGFAIPEQLAMNVMAQIIADGEVTRGWLGIELANVPSSGKGVGLEVTKVWPESPAEGALVAGDLIVAANEQPATSSAAVSRVIAATAPGEPIAIQLVRSSDETTEVREVSVKVGKRPPFSR